MEEGGTVNDAFKWDDGLGFDKKKPQLHAQQQSPEKWKTENKDSYRFFIDHEKIAQKDLSKVNKKEATFDEGDAEIVEEVILS